MTDPTLPPNPERAARTLDHPCRLCGGAILAYLWVDGAWRNQQNRRYCTACSPFRGQNTRRLELGPLPRKHMRYDQATVARKRRQAPAERIEALRLRADRWSDSRNPLLRVFAPDLHWLVERSRAGRVLTEEDRDRMRQIEDRLGQYRSGGNRALQVWAEDFRWLMEQVTRNTTAV